MTGATLVIDQVQGEMVCDSCEKNDAVALLQFANGVIEKWCLTCIEGWALEFGGVAAQWLAK